ncbi:MAG: thioredoxin family protein [Gammaproteobacteria bacterium]|nr:thioredoxin family protein [Pseudomonadales bacterium]
MDCHYALIVKKDCATCRLIEPVARVLSQRFEDGLSIYVQDDPAFPAELANRIDDRELEFSFQHEIEVVPTLIRFKADRELERIYGWDKRQWQTFLDMPELGNGLPDFKPGCGSKTREPGMEELLAVRFGRAVNSARTVVIEDDEDIMEACYERGWTDGLPVVPPTPLRVTRMLTATDRPADQLLGRIPPDYAPCSVEKAAINAVMAGCKPEYFPLLLTTIEAALQEPFCMHGLLCTTYFSSPLVIVNGPIAKQIGMNSGINALGQGNRANATIGRSLQLVIQNVGGGRPGGIDRATLGTPGKYSFCFAEDESDLDWPSLAMDRGYQRADSVVSLFAGAGVQPVMDQQSRTPESLTRSLAASLRTVSHAKVFMQTDALLVLSPEHRRVYREAGWQKADVRDSLYEALRCSGDQLIRGADGIAEGIPAQFKDRLVDKFREDGLHITTAGGTAGLFSAIIPGWVASGEKGSQLVSRRMSAP